MTLRWLTIPVLRWLVDCGWLRRDRMIDEVDLSGAAIRLRPHGKAELGPILIKRSHDEVLLLGRRVRL